MTEVRVKIKVPPDTSPAVLGDVVANRVWSETGEAWRPHSGSTVAGDVVELRWTVDADATSISTVITLLREEFDLPDDGVYIDESPPESGTPNPLI